MYHKTNPPSRDNRDNPNKVSRYRCNDLCKCRVRLRVFRNHALHAMARISNVLTYLSHSVTVTQLVRIQSWGKCGFNMSAIPTP